MATIGELRVYFAKKADYMVSPAALRDAQRFGNDLCAKIADRVINDGDTAKGGKFSPYSTKPVAAFRYFGQSRNSGGENRVRAAAKAGKSLSYSDFRVLNNLPVAFKNFSFTNYMWAHFGILDIQQTKTKIVITIGGITQIAAQRIKDNSDREGISIIKPTQKEAQTIANRIQNSIV